MAGGRTPPSPNDAHVVSRYSLTVDGAEVARFSELIELSSGLDPSELPSGPAQKRKAAPKKPPGKLISRTVTLRRGQANDLGLFAWHHDALSRAAARRDAVLVMYSVQGTAVAKYVLESAWPAKLEVTALKAGASEILYETVTLTCEDIQRVAP